MNGSFSIVKAYKIAVTDFFALAVVYLIPPFVHATNFPLYYFEPMRLLLFAALLVNRSNWNACFLAITLPLVSTLLPPHHPPFYKAVIISLELFINVAIFLWAVNKSKTPAFVLFFISAVISKFFYYGFKFIFIQLGLIQGQLVTTSFFTQLITLGALSLLLAIFYKRQKMPD